MLAAKVGVSALGTIAAATTTYLLVRSSDPMPACKTIADANENKNEYTNKIGSTYKHLLVSKDYKDNLYWWNWSKKRWAKDAGDKAASLATEFNKESLSGKDLKAVCDTIYMKNPADIALDEAGEETKRKLAQNLFTYCSPMGGLPVTLTNSKDQRHQSLDGQKNKLVSALGNDWFWDQKTREFYGKDAANMNGHDFFKGHLEKEKAKEEGKRRSLKLLCKEAYALGTDTASSANKPSSAELLVYCSLKGS